MRSQRNVTFRVRGNASARRETSFPGHRHGASRVLHSFYNCIVARLYIHIEVVIDLKATRRTSINLIYPLRRLFSLSRLVRSLSCHVIYFIALNLRARLNLLGRPIAISRVTRARSLSRAEHAACPQIFRDAILIIRRISTKRPRNVNAYVTRDYSESE